MTRSPLAAASGALLGLVLAGLTACSGGSDDAAPSAPSASRTVSVSQFCASIDGLDDIDTVAEAKKAVADLGTPEGMPSDAAAGLRSFRAALAKVDADTRAEDFSSVLLEAMGGTGGADVAKVQAFTTWVGTTCKG